MAPRKIQKGSANTAGIDLSQFEMILEFMAKHGLEEFEYEHAGIHIRLKKPSFNSGGTTRVLAAPEMLVATDSPIAPPPGAPAASREAPSEGVAEDLHVVKSPIVGTFYAAPSPGAEPFVNVGSHVELGQVLCIIEAMKLMNEIESDVAGEVLRVFMEDGQPVEYGEPLFGILPHRKK